MTKIPRSDADLILQLREQWSFLETSARLYDQGEYHEAKRLAATVRLFCHDTAASHALLAQLGVLKRLKFIDTNSMGETTERFAEVPRDRGVRYVTVFESGLAPAGGYPTGLVAPRGRATRYEPKNFKVWWNADALRDTPVSVLTRRDIVLMLANTDGGAHVDPVLEHRYDALSRNNGLGTFGYRTAEGVETVIDTNPALPIMRQMAFELMETLRPIVGSSADDSSVGWP